MARGPTHFGTGDALGTIRRGVRGRCPHCGTGRIFARWAVLHERCPDCGLQLLRKQGDLWAFLVVVDRLVIIAPMIGAYFFGLLPERVAPLVGIGLAAIVFFVVTTPNRTGLCLAIDYSTRRRWDDLADTPAPDG